MNVRAPGDEVTVLLGRGLKLYQAGDRQGALDVYEQILSISPLHVDALNMVGIVVWQGGDVSRALGYLDTAILHYPEDPQAYLNLGVILEHHGRTEEAVNAYRVALQADPDHLLASLNLANGLAAMGQTAAAIEAYQRVLRAAPENLDALNNLALALKSAHDLVGAERHLRAAVGIDPGSEQSWINLGLVLRRAKKTAAAFEACERALKINPASLKALNNLAVLHRWQGHLEQAESLIRDILKRHPDQVEVLNNLGDICQALGRLDEAQAAFEAVLAQDPNHAEGHHNLAVLLLLRGQFKAGWEHYEWRWLAEDFPAERRNFPQPLWTGEDLGGQTVLLYVEQGLGDAVQFVRYAKGVQGRGGRVVVECPKVLKRLFERVPGVDCVVARGDDLPGFTVQCPFLSLPGVLSTCEADIPPEVPYLFVPQDSRAWLEPLKNRQGLKVGLVWAGSPHHTNDRERSLDLSTLAPLAAVEGCHLVSLQIGPRAGQVAEVPWPMVDLTGHFDDYADTAAVIHELDLVITVDTSVAHVAGALAKPVWVLIPHAPDWRWQIDRDDSPWYPTMTLYRQTKRQDWGPVIERVRADLDAQLITRGKS